MMKTKLILLALLIAFAGCNSTPGNAKTGTQADTSSKAAAPIPQPGGFSNIDNAKAQELLDKGIPLIDIRREDEWKQTGVIKGSKPITFFDRTGRINPNFVPEFTAVTDPEKPVMLICRTGNRTAVASKAIAQQLGYKNVLNITHGITGWLSEKRPVVKYQK